MYGCESWAIKKAECRRMGAFELWRWRKLSRVPWTERRFNQSILKEISPEYSLEGLMLKLKFQYLGHLMWRTDSLEKTLVLGKIEGGQKRWRQRMRWLDGVTDSMDMSLSKLGTGDGQGGLTCCSHRESDTTEWLNWIELKMTSETVDHLNIFIHPSRCHFFTYLYLCFRTCVTDMNCAHLWNGTSYIMLKYFLLNFTLYKGKSFIFLWNVSSSSVLIKIPLRINWISQVVQW